MKSVKRHLNFDYFIYDLGRGGMNLFKKRCEDSNRYYFETPRGTDDDPSIQLDVVVTMGSDIYTHTYFEKTFTDDRLENILEDLEKDEVQLKNCVIVAFHDDDMKKDVDGIGQHLKVDYIDGRKYIHRLFKEVASMAIDEETEYHPFVYGDPMHVLFMKLDIYTLG